MSSMKIVCINIVYRLHNVFLLLVVPGPYIPPKRILWKEFFGGFFYWTDKPFR